MKRVVAKLMAEEKPDVIHAHLIRMAPYAIEYAETPKVLDICDSMTLNYERFLTYRRDLAAPVYRHEQKRTRAYETTVPAMFDASVVISPHDRDFILGLNSDASLSIVPNGVDFEYFVPSAEGRDPDLIAFMGTMSYFPNVDAAKWFAADILPIIKRTLHQAEFYIVGSNPASDIERLDNDKAITVTGFVDDVRPYVAPASVFVCPIRAATGLNNKVIEAMAMGLPVVATPGACEGIGVTPGKDILLAEQPMDFAEAVISLMTDTGLNQRIGKAGREFVMENFSWQHAGDKLRQVYAEVTA
jgi:glycosyltransferase involved in cell wall biosynthesis